MNGRENTSKFAKVTDMQDMDPFFSDPSAHRTLCPLVPQKNACETFGALRKRTPRNVLKYWLQTDGQK